ncbi:MAG: C40 family peptidase [Alphaproteobacteria bacterium]|nr:C40 family peptidase [Alphaproteobacteria bacterium]
MSATTKRPGLDSRVHAYRPDLAVASLQGRVEAGRFVDPRPARVNAGVVSVRQGPSGLQRQTSELLYGEIVDVVEIAGAWAWVQNRTDGYVGYVLAKNLSWHREDAGDASTHRVVALRSYVFPEPNLKVPATELLHMTSAVTVIEQRDGWARLSEGNWVWVRHLAPMTYTVPNWVATARRFMGAPYAWGGRSSIGLDCSALVQLALAGAGIAAPRDSDLQEAAVGAVVEGGGEAAEPGDLLFWPGHVAIMTGGGKILHANAHHMAVAEEKLSEFRARTLDSVGEVRTVRRPVGSRNQSP